MSLMPYIFREMMRPMRMMEQQLRVLPEEFFRPMNSVFNFPVLHGRNGVEYRDQGEAVISDKQKFQIMLDVKDFMPEELSVKTNDDNSIVIEGKHSDKQDNLGSISRHFIRKFVLPHGHEMQSIVSNLSADGILTITAPRKPEAELQERVVPITHTTTTTSIPEGETKKEDEPK